MTVSHRPGDDQNRDGMEITIRLTPSEAESVGKDALLMAEILDSCLWAMAMLRTNINSRDPGAPAPTQGDWAAALRGLDRLSPRLQGARDGVIRAYITAGGTIQRVAEALNMSASDAQHHSAQLTDDPPAVWEQWATSRRPGMRSSSAP
ncbi:hypothetical protein Aple_056530 [Acrocarpospora pleiomorpha]|uniref:Uncharacterized protein n=1 Tax=Acrocarpospora pleiomorpha TaxID=90975 RepID=A0A5M3XNF8_9ACTN|nr:hypothetical protein [Acrocarpospora pleiomorpha]GES22754.1 hypothetical protein Aple_056530 [Acrocarpospora pleiomorpha]